MFWWQVVVTRLYRHLQRVTWPALAGLTLAHAGVTALLLLLADKSSLLTDPITYIYWYAVTISTVGYGDYSPSTPEGMLVVSLWVIPFGLGLFGLVIGKLASTVSQVLEFSMKGQTDYSHLSDHIVLFGWEPKETRRMIELILGDTRRRARDILLCVTEDMTNPYTDSPMVKFVRVASYTDPQELQRTGLDNAYKVIIDGSNDEETLSIALRVGALVKGDKTHISAYFENPSTAELAKLAHSEMEISTSREAEVLTRSMQDPGSSRIYEQLLNTLHGNTQFSVDVPADVSLFPFSAFFRLFKERHQATIIGVAEKRLEGEVELNPPLERPVEGGNIIYYISSQRLHADDIDWGQLAAETKQGADG